MSARLSGNRVNIYLPQRVLDRMAEYIRRTGRRVNVSALATAAITAHLDRQEAEEEVMYLFRGETRSTT